MISFYSSKKSPLIAVLKKSFPRNSTTYSTPISEISIYDWYSSASQLGWFGLAHFCYKWVNLFFYSRHQISTAYLWLAKGVSHFNKWWPTSTLTFENKQMSLSTNEDTCIFLKVKLVRDSGPRGCCSIMDPMNNCSKMLVRPKECYNIMDSSDVKIGILLTKLF